MIGTRSAAVVAAIVAMAFLGCAGRDIDKLCPIAEAVKNDESLPPELKHAVFVRRGKSEVSSTAAKNVLDALGAVSATDRVKIMKQGALECGRESWSCPAYEAIAAQAP